MHGDLDLLFIALGSPLKCVAVDEVVSRMKIVAPGRSSLGCRGTYRRPASKDKKTSGDSDNRSRVWAGVMQSLLALDEEANKVVKSLDAAQPYSLSSAHARSTRASALRRDSTAGKRGSDSRRLVCALIKARRAPPGAKASWASSRPAALPKQSQSLRPDKCSGRTSVDCGRSPGTMSTGSGP